MPDPRSMANLTFVAISCNVEEEEGLWKGLGWAGDDVPELRTLNDDYYRPRLAGAGRLF